MFAECSKFGIGLLARDADGKVVQGRSEVFDGQVRAELAEAVAVEEALSWVKDKQWPEVIIETDCLVVIQAIRSKVPMTSPLGSVIMECRGLVGELN